MTRKPILYNIHVEEYHVNRVMRQFDLYQQTPVPIVHSVEAYVHRYRINSSVNNSSSFYNLPFSIESLKLCTHSTTLGRPRLQSDVAGGEGASADASSL